MVLLDRRRRNWNLLTGVTESNALLLAADSATRLYFEPNPGFTGLVVNPLQFHAWDQTSGLNGDFADSTINGGSTAFSTEIEYVSVPVNPANQAPTITNGFVVGLPGADEDSATIGTTVSAIVNNAGWADPDAGPVRGMAITGITGNGIWEYSTDGLTWNSFGAVSATNALLLSGTSQVRYVGDGLDGEVPDFTFRAWDQTTGTVSTNTTPSFADPGTGGGTSAFSSELASANATITAVNDAPTFGDGTPLPGNDGIVTTDIASDSNNVFAMTVQADGKILAIGYSGNGSTRDIALLRYHPNGSLDTSFGGGGVVITDIAGTADLGFDVAIQPDGKILVSGQTFNGTDYDFALIRYNSDGSLDATFGTGGIVTTDFAGLDDHGKGMTLQTDGKILVTGVTNNGADYDFALARYNSDGSLDASFGTAGLVTTGIGPGDDQAVDVAVQPDGKILVSGESFNGANSDFALVRYNVDGSLDAGFGAGGRVTTDFALGVDKGVRLTLQPDGKILVAGHSFNGTDYDFALARYNADGSLDTGFGTGGKLTTAIGASDDVAYNVAVQADGKILVSGDSDNGSDDDFAVVRYNNDGTLDTSFGTGGIVTTGVGASHDKARAFALQPDGKIVLAGYSDTGTDSDSDIALVRLNSDGTLDTQFDATNTLDGNPGFVEDGAAVVLDPDVNVFDVELAASGNYDSATLSISRNGGANADDQFSGAGNLVFSAGNLILSGITIGTVDTNSGGTLQLTFNSNATQARINEALQSIAYSNSSNAPPASVQLDWNFSDGNSGAQGAGGPLSVTGSTVVDITAVNDAPVNYAIGPKTVVEETATAIVGLAIDDVDAGLSLVTTRLVVSNGVLNVTLAGSATISAGANDSADLTIEGTVAEINATLATLNYTGNTDVVGAGADSLAIITNDGGNTGTGGSNTVVNFVLINIDPVNDAPTASIIPSGYGVTEDDGYRPLAGFSVSDVDAGASELAVTLTVTQGVINLTNTAGLTFTSGANDSSTMTFTGTLANLNNALATLAYRANSDFAGSDTVTMLVDDQGNTGGPAQTGVDSATITVAAVNDAPVQTGGTVANLTVDEDSGLTSLGLVGLTYGPGGGADEAAQSLAIEVMVYPDPNFFGKIYLADGITQVTSGVYTLADLQGMQFEAAPDASGGPSFFQWRIVDDGGTGNGGQDSISQFILININPVNDSPTVATNTGLTLGQGQTGITITSAMLNEGDVDDSGTELTYTVTSAPGSGTLRLFGIAIGTGATFTQQDIDFGNLTYDHNGAEVFTDNFGFTLADGGEDGALPAAGIFNININPLNDPPVITTGNLNVAENQTAAGTVVASDPDLPPDTLTWNITGAARTMPCSPSTRPPVTFRLLAPPNFEIPGDNDGDNIYEIEVEVNDGTVSVQKIITVTVTDANDAPVISTTSLNVSENQTLVGTVMASDEDQPADSLTWFIFGGDDGGHFSIDGSTGDLSFVTPPDFELPGDLDGDNNYELLVGVSDGSVSSIRSITVSVTPVNDNTPDAGLDFATTVAEASANGTLVGTVSASDLDLPGDTLTYTITGGDPLNGFSIDAAGNITIANAAVLDLDFDDGSDLVATLTVTVGDGTFSDTVDVTVRVTPVNDNTPDAGLDFTTTVAEASANGTLVGTVSASDLDLPGDTLTYTITGGDPLNGFSIDAAGNITIANAAVLDLDFDDGSDLVATLTVTVGDGTFSDTVDVTVRVTPINEPPTVFDDAFTVDENAANGTLVGSVTAGDSDPGDSLVYRITAGDPGGIFAIDASGNITVADGSQLDFESSASRTLTVQVTDSGGLTDTATIAVGINDVNDAPVLTNTGATVAEGSSEIIDSAELRATDQDNSPLQLVYTVTAGPANGFLALATSPTIPVNTFTQADIAAGQLIYVHDGSNTTGDQFTFDLSDGSGAVITGQQFDVTVNSVNNAPTASDDSFAINEDQTLAGSSVLANDTDIEGDPLGAVLVSGPANASHFVLNTDGTFTYTPAPDFNGTDSFRYLVNDGTSNSNIATVTITIAAVNDAPRGQADRYTVTPDQSLIELVGVLANDNDPENDALEAILVNAPAHGTLVLQRDGSFTYNPDPGFAGFDSFTYVPHDGSQSGTLINVQLEVLGSGPIDDNTDPDDSPDPFDDHSRDDRHDNDPADSGDDGNDEEIPGSDPFGPTGTGPVPGSGNADDRPGTSRSSGVLDQILSDQGRNNRAWIPNSSQAAEVLEMMLACYRHNEDPDQEDSLERLGRLTFVFNTRFLWDQLDKLADDVLGGDQFEYVLTTSIAVSTISATAGYILWSLRGGCLMATLVSSLPAWSHFDPLPVLESGPRHRQNGTSDPGDGMFD